MCGTTKKAKPLYGLIEQMKKIFYEDIQDIFHSRLFPRLFYS